MYRKAMEKLFAWKSSSRRKPLVLKGARQVGKTWLMREFARKAYDDSIYISFDKDVDAVKIFDDTKDPKLKTHTHSRLMKCLITSSCFCWMWA